MSHLKTLKLASAELARVIVDPAQRIREKVIASLADQKAMAEAKIVGQTYAPTQMVWRKNGAGERIQVEKPRRVRQGWFEDAQQKTFFALRYAGRTIELAKGRNAVEVSALDKLPGIIDQLIDATKAGELDEQLCIGGQGAQQSAGRFYQRDDGSVTGPFRRVGGLVRRRVVALGGATSLG